MQRRGGFNGPPPPQQQQQAPPQAFDNEFASLMEELGEKPTTAPIQNSAAPATVDQLIANAPWRNPSNWFGSGPARGYDDGYGYSRSNDREYQRY